MPPKMKIEMTARERALYEGEDEFNDIDLDKNKDFDAESQGETTSTGGRSKHTSMDLAGSVFLIASNGRLLSLPIASESPNDPLSWDRSRRIFIFVILLIYSAIALFLIQTPGLLFKAFALSYDDEDMYPFSVACLASSPTLAMGVGFFLWIPLSVAFGRRPVILASSIMLTGATLGAGFASNFYVLLVGICLIGFAGGATLSTALLQLIDVTYIHERPLAIAAFWSLGSGIALPTLAAVPIIMDTSTHWRPVYTVAAIPLSMITLAIFLYVPETYFQRPPVAFDGRVLVQSGTEKVKIYDDWFEIPGRDNTAINFIADRPPAIHELPLHTWRVSSLQLWRSSVADPKAAAACLIQIFLCLANPLVFWVALLNAVNFAGMMSIGVGYPVVMSSPPYDLSAHAVGAVSFTSGLSCLLALPASYYLLNNAMKRLTLRNRGIRHAEFYLPAFVLPVTTGALSVFIYGLAAARSWHPAFYHLAYGLNAMSFVSGSIANTAWVTESLPQWAAPGIAVVGGVSYVASWAVTAALPVWVASWGVLPVNVGIGIGILLVGLLAIPLAFWGKSVRQFINGRWGEYEVGALRPQSRTKGEQRIGR